LALLGFLVLLPLQARADSIESRERAARMACLSGDYDKGVAILSELFVDTKDKTYIYNQGRCFEQNGRYEEAILRFREYLRKIRDTGGAPDADAERHMADCEALQAKERGQEPDSTAPAPVASPTVPAQPEKVIQVPAKIERKGAGLRIAGISTAAVGVAALATGLILNLKANSIADELESTTDNYQRSKESTRRSYKTFGWISYGIGAAGAVGGTILYLIGRSRSNEASLAFLPSVGPGGAGAVLQGAF
jgi:tetratricopeptide (TPR) repeat protein